MIAAALIAILIGMALLMLRAFIGPTLYDRILAVNSFGTKTVLALGLLGFVMKRPHSSGGPTPTCPSPSATTASRTAC